MCDVDHAVGRSDCGSGCDDHGATMTTASVDGGAGNVKVLEWLSTAYGVDIDLYGMTAHLLVDI